MNDAVRNLRYCINVQKTSNYTSEGVLYTPVHHALERFRKEHKFTECLSIMYNFLSEGTSRSILTVPSGQHTSVDTIEAMVCFSIIVKDERTWNHYKLKSPELTTDEGIGKVLHLYIERSCMVIEESSISESQFVRYEAIARIGPIHDL